MTAELGDTFYKQQNIGLGKFYEICPIVCYCDGFCALKYLTISSALDIITKVTLWTNKKQNQETKSLSTRSAGHLSVGIRDIY